MPIVLFYCGEQGTMSFARALLYMQVFRHADVCMYVDSAGKLIKDSALVFLD